MFSGIEGGLSMNIDRIENNMLNFRFPEEEGFLYGFNLYALLNGNDVLLMDSAFRTQARQVAGYLKSKGLTLTHVLITHFHTDHAAGLVALDPDITVLGSPEYRRTLTKDIPQRVTPVSFSEGFRFGNFSLAFTPAPGHSACSILIDINGEYLHAGDNLMSRYDGKAILPWVEYHELASHISSLEMLKEMNRERIILAHGPILSGQAEINRAIDDRLSYLRAVLLSAGKCSYEQAVCDCSCDYTGREFFEQLAAESAITVPLCK